MFSPILRTPMRGKQKTTTETPLMTQYNAVKAQYRDAVVFFRMGDFYEMFNEDARVGARVLGITLTSRGHGKAGDVPLAGFPYHALEGYLAKMIKAGHRVAICEQVEDPKLAKGIVKREVVRVVTPGTVMADNLLETKRNNYLSAVFLRDGRCGLASADVSTGEFVVSEFDVAKLVEEVQAIGPTEILVQEGSLEEVRKRVSKNGVPTVLTKQDDWVFSRDFGFEILTQHFGTTSLKGFGCEDLDEGLSAAGAVLNYLKDTQKTDLSHIRRISRYADDDFMHLDAATRQNLEITTSIMASGREGTLLSILDRTRTPMGGRTLSSWIRRPLNQLEPIRERLEGVGELVGAKDVRVELVKTLRSMGDIERLITKVVTRRVTPRDLQSLSRTLSTIPAVKQSLFDMVSGMLVSIREGLSSCEEVIERVEKALVDEPPLGMGDGGIIREG